jgi:hypothetical protein
MKHYYYFDIDYTLIIPESKLVIIDKKNPSEILHRFSNSDEILLKTHWKRYNNNVQYNGKEFYISDDLKKKIDLPLDRIGISYREWKDEEILNKQSKNLEFLQYNIEHLKNIKDDYEICLLSARSRIYNHDEFLSKLKRCVYDITFKNINKIYFIDNLEDVENEDEISFRKSKILLETLIGYKIKNNKFTNLECPVSTHVHFYDDDNKNIDYSKKLQEIFDMVLINTQDLNLVKKILERVQTENLYYNINMITNNKLNKFVTNTNVLKKPLNVLKFKDF